MRSFLDDACWEYYAKLSIDAVIDTLAGVKIKMAQVKIECCCVTTVTILIFLGVLIVSIFNVIPPQVSQPVAPQMPQNRNDLFLPAWKG